MGGLVGKWDDGKNLGLVAYGHRSQGDCTDIETLIAPGPLDKASFIDTVGDIKPVGKTPISAAVQHAADLMSYRDNPATVVLISDGVETCNADPCALSAQLAKQGVKFTAHVVGFDLKKDENANLSCIAENTGGMFVSASNAAELNDALTQVTETIEEVPSTTPEPKPELPEVTLTGPERVTTGAVFDFSWSGSINGRDFITIVPAGADEGTANDYIRVKDASEGRLTAPGTPGLYELRYVLEQGRRTLASAPLEVVGIDAPLDDGAGLSVPETASPGETITVTWTGESNSTDQRIAVAHKDQPDFSWISVQKVGDQKTLDLKIPDETGLYEVRFLDVSGREVLGRSVVEVK